MDASLHVCVPYPLPSHSAALLSLPSLSNLAIILFALFKAFQMTPAQPHSISPCSVSVTIVIVYYILATYIV
ncbi:uncharacterized protein ARMOST_16190 [Armillaria ostoyae]|uniref:Uncharacterized protein n=1 Tax=Armillaria ostoyae TaxID=47428 RepID=A0A284RVH6_ARMOS|nr:uncharacterized protein ARMOST_16190 [Armillaria ostoyae]